MENTENSEFLESLQVFRDCIWTDRSSVTQSAIGSVIKTFEEAGVDFNEFLHSFIYAVENRVKPRSFEMLMEVVDLERGWVEEGDQSIALEREEKEKQVSKQKKRGG